jgi:hypothetical protein
MTMNKLPMARKKMCELPVMMERRCPKKKMNIEL